MKLWRMRIGWGDGGMTGEVLYAKCTECDGWHRTSLGHKDGLHWTLVELSTVTQNALFGPGRMPLPYMILYESALLLAREQAISLSEHSPHLRVFPE